MLKLLAVVMLALAPATQPAVSDEEAKYTATIDKRAADVVKDLAIDDADKAKRVHEIIMNQYRAIRAWDDENGPKMRQKGITPEEKAKILETRKPLHDAYLATLQQELTPEQIEKVKDKMTFNRRNVAYNGFVEMLPELTDAQKKQIMDYLIEARELAMDGASSEEKHAIFGRYVGRINNYLSKEGYDLKKASKDWAERRRAQRND